MKILLGPLWVLAAGLALRFRLRPKVAYAADLEAGLAAAISGRPFVYDVLDTYADRYEVPAFVRRALRWLENQVVRSSHILVHVDDIRKGTLRFHDRTIVVRNVPAAVPSRATNGRGSSTDLRVAATGNLNEARGMAQLVAAVKVVKGVRVLMAGKLSPTVEAAIGGDARFEYHGYLSSEDALALTAGSDVVFAAYDPQRRINRMACPNKYYDALFCGKPVLTNDEVILAGPLVDAGLGWSYPFSNIEALEALLQRLKDPEARASAEQRVKQASKGIGGWSVEFSPVLSELDVLLQQVQ